MHNGQKPYICEICKKSFNERSNYTKHLRIHSGYKPYKCTQCGRAFTQSSNLNVHKRKCQYLVETFRTTNSSTSAGLFKPKTSTANELNSGLSHYNYTLASTSRNNTESSQHLATNNQNNKFSHVSNKYSVSFPLPEQTLVSEKISSKESARNPISEVLEQSQDCENVTCYSCELCGENFDNSSDLIKHKIIHDIPKPYKCSFCHKAFTRLTNYNLHRTACKWKSNMIRIRNSSIVPNSEIKDVEISSENSSSLLPSNSDPSINMPEISAAAESDCYETKSSIYFSKRNELSLISTSNLQQNKQLTVAGNFPQTLSLFDDEATEIKIIPNELDKNSSQDLDLDSPGSEKPSISQQVSLEKNKERSFEERNNLVSCNGQPDIQTLSLSDTSDLINKNSTNEKKSKNLQSKITSIANSEKFFQCKLHYCRKIFHLASELKNHTKQHKRRGVYTCKFCKKQFNESSNLIKHKRIHTGAKPYKCEFCNRFFSQSSNRNVHRKSCSKSATRNQGFLSGISCLTKTQTAIESDLQCEFCLQQFKQVSDLHTHKKSCKLINNEETKNNALQKKSLGDSNFTGKTYKLRSSKPLSIKEQSTHFRKLNSLAPLSQGSLTNTLRSVPLQKHNLNGQYMFQCHYTQCGKIFKMASVLRRHIKDHSEKQSQCEFCGKKFNTSSNLSKHRRIHTGQKPYSCSLCGKHFTQSSNLNVHRKTCNGSTKRDSLNYSSLKKDLASLDGKNENKLTEKPHLASDLHITGIIENSHKGSNKEQSLQTETYNQVISIDDNGEEEIRELNIIQPAKSVSCSTILLPKVEEDECDEPCEILSVTSPKTCLEIESTHHTICPKNIQPIATDVIEIGQSPEENIQDGGITQKVLEAKSRPYKTFNQFFGGEHSDNTLRDSVNNPSSLFNVTSQIGSGGNLNNVHNDSSFSSIQTIRNTSIASSKSKINLPIYSSSNDNNNLKQLIKMPSNHNMTSEKFVNISKFHKIYPCKVRSCRKVCKSEQELRTHQCKRRTYPCEYCHKRFNESSNLIKHRRIHTGHKPYRCKFCGKTFTQSSNLNVHRKICAKKHSLVEHRFAQHLVCDRNVMECKESVSKDARSSQANRDYLEINLSEDSISSIHQNEMTKASNSDTGDYLNPIEATLSNGESHSPKIASVNSLVIENCMTVTKLEDAASTKTNVYQNSDIIVENSLTGEVKLQISEEELNAFENKEVLPDTTRMIDNQEEFENSQDDTQVRRSLNEIPIVLKKEVDDSLDSNIVISQSNTQSLENVSVSQLETDNMYNSTQSVSALSPRLDLVPNSSTQLMHKFNSCAKTIKTSAQLKKHTMMHQKRHHTYACEFCKRRFNESSNLIKHRRIHTGLRPYKCQFCGKTFTQSSNRNVHKKICARKYQLSGSIVQSHVSSDNSLMNLCGLKTNKTTKHQKTNMLQTSDNYCNSDVPLTLNHKMTNTATASSYTSVLSHNTGNDTESGSSGNDNEPICSISSVTSLRENPYSHLQFFETKTESFEPILVQDINPAINGSTSQNSESPTTPSADANNQPSTFVGSVDSLDAQVSENSISHFLTYDIPFSSSMEVAPSNPSYNFNQAFLCKNQNQFPRNYFQCLFCPRLCKNSADFQRHMRVHTGHKPYKCKICGKLFTDYSNLSKHRRVHTGFKPYKCSLCLKTFSQSSNLNVHKKHCKGIQHKNLTSCVNLPPRSKEVTNSVNKTGLNNQASQILPTNNLMSLGNPTLSSQGDHSSTSRLMSESQSGHFINKPTSTSSKSAAQRISLKYLNKITPRCNKNLSKGLDAFSKTQIFTSESNRFLNPNMSVVEGSNSRNTKTMTFSPTLNNFASHLTKDGSYLQMVNVEGLTNPLTEKMTSNIRNKKPSYQTKWKRYVSRHIRRKHYYCEYCNRKFNESSNLTKHRRIHTGHKPYKCQFCSKMFTQSSNLNVHKRICKALSQNAENSKDTVQNVSNKNNDKLDNASIFQTSPDDKISEMPSNDEKFHSSCSSDMKQSVQQTTKDSITPPQIPENENSKDPVNLSTEMSSLTNASEISGNCLEVNSPKTDVFLLDNEEKTSRESCQAASDPQSPIYNEDVSQNSVPTTSNAEIFISSPKHQKYDQQENHLQNRQLGNLDYNDLIENKSESSASNESSIKKTISVYESNVKDEAQNCLTKVGTTNKHSDGQNTEISKDNSTCNSSSDLENINNSSLDVQMTVQHISSNQEISAGVSQPSLMPSCSQSYNPGKSGTDPETAQMDTRQFLLNYNKSVNEYISNDLSNLSVSSQHKNSDHSNPPQPVVLSDAQLSQTPKQDQVPPTCKLKFTHEPSLKHEDVFSCSDTDIELVQLQPQQSDMLKSIQSAINGILQTEAISSSGDQADQPLLPNTGSDWFKIEPTDLNDIVSSSKNADSTLLDQIDDDDVIIMDSSAGFQLMKPKSNFVEDIQHLDKTSHPETSENNPVSAFASTLEIRPTVKSESGIHLQKNCNISDPLILHNDQSLLLSDGYPREQLNSNSFVHDNDDDVAIIDVKSTLPVKVETNSNIALSNLNYNPTYFSNNDKVSLAACKSDMDIFSKDTITNQTDSQLDSIQESFDYLMPNIADQLLSESSCKVSETSCQSKQQNISPNENCVYECEFCQEKFLTPSSLVRHCCPNTGDKPYVCPDCGKAFTQYTNVIAHKSTCLKLSVKIADFSSLTNINISKDNDRHAGDHEKDIQPSTIDLTHWSGEYNFNSDTHEKMLVPVSQNSITDIQNSESINRKRIQESNEAKTCTQATKYEITNQVSEFPSQNIEMVLNNYDCIPMDHYNISSSLLNSRQTVLGNKFGHFLSNSFADNDNSVVDIASILPSTESLPSNNTESSLTSSTTPVALGKSSSNRLSPDNPNFQPHPNKHLSFSSNDFSYMHVDNYQQQNGISNIIDPNVLLKDLAVELSPNRTSKYSLPTSTSSFLSSAHSNTSIPASSSSSASSSSTSFINVLNPAVTVSSVPCQYCDKLLSLSELGSHTCSGTAQANRYTCNICEKTLCDASSLSKHLRIHTGHKPYSCEFCGKAFTQSSNLNVHKRICKDKANPLQPT